MLIYLILRAFILILIINYNLLKIGHFVKGALTGVGSLQILHNLVLFKLYLPAFGDFSFCSNLIFCSTL